MRNEVRLLLFNNRFFSVVTRILTVCYRNSEKTIKTEYEYETYKQLHIYVRGAEKMEWILTYNCDR